MTDDLMEAIEDEYLHQSRRSWDTADGGISANLLDRIKNALEARDARIAALEAALKKLDAAFALLLLDCVNEDYIENYPNEYAEYISAVKAARAAMEGKDD